MRILVLHSQYLSRDSSGENRSIEERVKLLRSAGHEVTFWSPGPQAATPLDLVKVGASAIWSRSAVARVRELVATTRADIIHCGNLFPLLSPGVLAAGRGARVVLSLSNYRLLCLPASLMRRGVACEACLGRLPWRGVVHRCYRGSVLGSAVLAGSLSLHRGLGTFDHVRAFLAVSLYVRDKHVAAGFPSDRVWVVPNFAAAAPRRRGPGEYFVYVGRLSREKGVSTLLEAWHDLPDRLVVVGDGPEAQHLARVAPRNVELRGRVRHEEVARLMSNARAVLVPSLWPDPLPRVVMEAYASGVAVVGSETGGIAEQVIDGVSGLLVPPGEPDAWARAVGRLRDDDVSALLGRGAYELWRERYSPQRALAALETVYREVLDGD